MAGQKVGLGKRPGLRSEWHERPRRGETGTLVILDSQPQNGWERMPGVYRREFLRRSEVL